MTTLIRLLTEYLPFTVWFVAQALGGIWLAQSTFNLRKNEQVMAGLALGVVLQTWLANLLAQFLLFPTAMLASALAIFAAGLALSLPRVRKDPLALIRLPFNPWQWLALVLLSYVLIRVGRGMAILDDYQNLTLASIIATGDVPPHFPLDPSRVYGYHYFTLFFAAELMRIADMFVWTAVDIARGFGTALGLILGALFVNRITQSKVAGVLAAAFGFLTGGTRWLLLLLPVGIVERISAHITLIGSGAGSAANLAAALVAPWASDGLGPYPIPFAFVNGFNTSSTILYHSGAGGVAGLMGSLLLLFHNRWTGWRSGAVIALLVAAMALGNEVGFLTLPGGFLLAAVLYRLIHKKWPPSSLWRWFAAFALAAVFAIVQGGVLSGIAGNLLGKFVPALGGSEAYHTFQFGFVWPPTLISSHLGQLNLLDPYQLLAAAVEIGPIILFLPLVIAWGFKALRFGRWYEAAGIMTALVSTVLVVFQYSGTAGPTALTRVQAALVGLSSAWAVPAVWMWARKRSDAIKTLSVTTLFVTVIGGLVLFGIQLISVPKPVYSYFINDLDAAMTQKYWNELEPGSMVFDPDPYRSPVVFGRPNNSSTNQYARKPEWQALTENPSPYKLRESGYRYMYFGEAWWDELTPANQEQLIQPCAVLIDENSQIFPRDFRRLYDLSGCQ